MTLQDSAQAFVETNISREGRRLFEYLGYAAFLLMAVVPVGLGLADSDLTKRVVDLQIPIGGAEAALGLFVGWMKSMGHKENMQQMKAVT